MTKAKATKITNEAPAKEAAAAAAAGPVTRDPAPGFDKNELPAERAVSSNVIGDGDVKPQAEPRKDAPAEAPQPVERETRAVRKKGSSDVQPDDNDHRFPGRY